MKTEGITVLLLLLMCHLLKADTQHEVKEGINKDYCTLDHDHSLPSLEKCLAKGESFLHTYQRRLLKRKDRSHMCRDYIEFRDCIDTEAARCPEQVTAILNEEWRHISAIMDCHCNVTTGPPVCHDELPCIEDELLGLFASRCQEYHRFNTEQKTHHKCHFHQHELQCKERLVGSACGPQAASFSVALSQIVGRKHSCHLSKPRHPTGFEYSEVCPRNLTKIIRECATSAFDQKRGTISFNSLNDLIADHKKKEVKKACRRFEQYRECIEPLENSCPNGLQQVLDMQQNTHVYMLKMKYICLEAKEDYYDHLQCYKRTQKNGTLDQCSPIWNGTLMYLHKLSAVDFFCNSSHDRDQVLIKLDELRQCFQSRFTSFCGATAGQTMGTFIKTVITDPFYLGYEFLPDCSLHSHTTTGRPPITSRAMTSPVRATTPASARKRPPPPRPSAERARNSAVTSSSASSFRAISTSSLSSFYSAQRQLHLLVITLLYILLQMYIL